MSTQTKPGALSAAHTLFPKGRTEMRILPQHVEQAAHIIDREAVKPAAAELLAALKKMLSYAEHSTQGQSAIKTERRGRSLTKSQADFLNDAMTARAVIASFTGDSRQHEART